MKILNIAAGKQQPLILNETKDLLPTYTINIDTGYYHYTDAEYVEKSIIEWEYNEYKASEQIFCNENINSFMEKTILNFDHVVIYRYLEHVSFTQIDYFIYLLSTITNKDAIVDIIVPNYKILAQMILDEDDNIIKNKFGIYDDFEGWNIELTTELLNESSCPHTSIWTPSRAVKFWEREKRFKVVDMIEKFSFDGRDIYMRFIAKRV